MRSGIVAYGTYVPLWRLASASIAAALGAGPTTGTRAIASFDEDTTTMAVEAVRSMLAFADDVEPESLVLATANPVYAEKTNAAIVHAATGMNSSVMAWDAAGSLRSAQGAVHAAIETTKSTLVVASDIRVGLPGSADERGGGDGSAALLFGTKQVIAEVLGTATVSEEFADRYRTPGYPFAHTWEERFGEGRYLALGEAAIVGAIKNAGIMAEDVDHIVLAGLHDRAKRALRGRLGLRPECGSSDLTPTIGNTGSASAALALADVLNRAEPGDIIVAVTMADGADAIVLSATPLLAERRRRRGDSVVAAPGVPTSYMKYLAWRGLLRLEPPRRPEPARHSAPAAYRHNDWKFGFVGAECRNCGMRQVPPQRVCARCQAVDLMKPINFAGVQGTVAMFTVDRLAYSLNPPVVDVIVNFDGGGRLACELADVGPDSIALGDRVAMAFRRINTGAGLHNYFWKARPTKNEGAN